MTTLNETETIPESVLPLYASLDDETAPPQSIVAFATRMIEDAALGGGDYQPFIVEANTLAPMIARAILADRRRQMPGAIELYRLLKANRKRRYADIAKLIAAHIGGAP